MNPSRRRFVSSGICCVAASALPFSVRGAVDSKVTLGNSVVHSVSDGNLVLPSGMFFPDSIDKAEKEAFLSANNLTGESFEPDCNLTLWQTEDRLVLFDVGSGPNFMPTSGKALDSLAELDIDPADITDVVFTHAHPDHLWGLIDDFDELAFPEARYFINEVEWDYWRHKDTIDNLPEERKTFAVGAQNRMQFLEEQINLFGYGDEVLPGLEAVDTHGHTPGHTSFALHEGSESVLVLGDALTHPIISFQKADWPSGSDQDPEAGKATRLSLLDRLATDQMRLLGFHMPYPGAGRVEKDGSVYRYVT